MELSANAVEVLNRRYLLKNDKGKVIEKPEQMFARVAKNISAVDEDYGEDSKKSAEEFFSNDSNFVL